MMGIACLRMHSNRPSHIGNPPYLADLVLTAILSSHSAPQSCLAVPVLAFAHFSHAHVWPCLSSYVCPHSLRSSPEPSTGIACPAQQPQPSTSIDCSCATASCPCATAFPAQQPSPRNSLSLCRTVPVQDSCAALPSSPLRKAAWSRAWSQLASRVCVHTFSAVRANIFSK